MLPARLRPVRQGRRLARLRAGARDRPGPRGGPRRDDLGRLAGRWRDDVPGDAAASALPARYGRVIRTSSTAASTVLADPTSAASNTIRTFWPAHGVMRDADRGPGRVVDVRGADLLADERPRPVLALDVGPEVVRGRRVRAVGEVVAERQLAGRRRDGDRRRADGRDAVEVVRSSRSTRPAAPVTSARAPETVVPACRAVADGLPRCHAPAGRGVGAERVDVPARARSRSRRRTGRSSASSCR